MKPDESPVDWARRVNARWIVHDRLREAARAYLEHLAAADPKRLAAACRAARTLVETRPDRAEDPKPLFYGGLFSHATAEEKERYLSGHLFTRLAAGAGARGETARLGAATRARLRQVRERIKTQTRS